MPPVSDLIGVTGEGAIGLYQDLEEPVPLCQVIFLHRDDDIRVWFLANNGHDALDLMVVESSPEDGADPVETHEPPNGRHPFFDPEVWDDAAGAEYATREMQEEEWIDEDEWLSLSRREQRGHLPVLALLLWTTAT